MENDLFSPPAAAPAPVLVRAVLCLSLLFCRVDRLRCAGPVCESYKIALYMTPYLKKFEFYKISPLSKSVKHQKDKVTIWRYHNYHISVSLLWAAAMIWHEVAKTWPDPTLWHHVVVSKHSTLQMDIKMQFLKLIGQNWDSDRTLGLKPDLQKRIWHENLKFW